MSAFTAFLLVLILAVSNASNAQLPGPAKPPHGHFNYGRDKSSFQDWTPFQGASPKNLNFQEPLYSTFAKPPDVSALQQSPEYSTPWLPINTSRDLHSSGYRSEAPRLPELYHPPSPAQRGQAPVQHTPPPPAIPSQPLNRFHVQPPYDANLPKQQTHFGGPQLESPAHKQIPGSNHYSNENHAQFPPSSYDVPLYAPMYEPGTNEDYSQAYMQPFDWSSLANALGQPPSAPYPQRPPNQRYKIVFIKTSRIPGYHPTTPPPPPPDEEKTLIYVLINKPDYDRVTSPAPPPSTTPSRPEVFFIQYKTKPNQAQTGSNTETESGATDQRLYEEQNTNQQRYGITTISKSVEANSL